MRNCKSSGRNTQENTMSHLYFNEQSDYSDENTCGNEVFRLPFLTISVWAWTDESAAALLHIRIGNLQKALQKWSIEIWLMIKRNKEIDVFVVERWIQCLLFRIKSQSARGHLAIQFLWASVWLVVTRVNLNT